MSELVAFVDEARYAAAGVDIDAGNRLVELIKPLVRATARAGAGAEIGGFGGLFDLKAAGFTDPILVAATDGVGTKVKIAVETSRHDTIGIDLVAMSVNDLVVQGAEPLFFLDYFACGKLDPAVGAAVVKGVAAACREAGCALIGGETAEMPGVYQGNDYDLAGFAVGAVGRNDVLPRADIVPGDVVVGLASTGVHSNGFSLVRRVAAKAGLTWDSPAPFERSQRLGEALLTPTRLYVRSCLAAIRTTKAVKALAHITGGGFTENIPRVLPQGLGVSLELARVPVSPVFKWLATAGNISEQEMLPHFQLRHRHDRRAGSRWCGRCKRVPCQERRSGGSARQSRCGHRQRRRISRTPRSGPVSRMAKKRVAVLISGRGSNMTALIEAAKAKDYPAEIALVVSNRPDALGLARAREAGIATALVDHRPFGDDREAFERALDAELTAQRIDIVCLAGFMRLFTPRFVTRWSGRMLNIHPALLPQFKGLHTHRRALQAGVKRHGATVHFVVPETDCGPIIVQDFGPGDRRRHRRDARRARAGSRAPHLSAGAAPGRRRRGNVRSRRQR